MKNKKLVSKSKKEASQDELFEFVLNVSYQQYGSGGLLPSSYFITRSYWREAASKNRSFHDSAKGYHLRLITHYCLNLYCASCRQLALATSDRIDAWESADRHTRILITEEIGETNRLRAWSDEPGQWQYGDPKKRFPRQTGSAFFYGAICDRIDLVDPLTERTSFPEKLGGSRFKWSYFDPFLGENTWATLISPLQIAYKKLGCGQTNLDVIANELQLARSILPACKAMQSKIGAVYARPASCGESQEQLIVNETNLTLFAGLWMLRSLTADVPDIHNEDTIIDDLIEGLRSYFRGYLFGRKNGESRIHACGIFHNGEFLPDTSIFGKTVRFAVDVHTWGMSILGVDEIDSRHGPGACFDLWRRVKYHAGYYPSGNTDDPICGVGYSSGPQGEPIHTICSPEWTFGAINMCRILAAEYELPGPHYNPEIANQLRIDEKSMLVGVESFEFSPQTDFKSRAYPYVNQLCETGFGWDAIPVASLCSTAWAILIGMGFNPFRLGGEYLSSAFPINMSNS